VTKDGVGRIAYSCYRLQRPGTAEISELARVWAAVFGTCRFRRKKRLEDIFTAVPRNSAIFTAKAGTEIIGFVHLQAGNDNSVWHNRGIGVLSSYRRLNVGRKLLAEAINFARQLQITAIVSYVDKGNAPALALHVRLGFKRDLSLPGQRSELRHRLRLEL